MEQAIDWVGVFSFDTPALEIFVRGTCMYFAIFFLMRILKRQAGSLDTSDLLVVVLIADAAQNGMAGSYNSVADGIVLIVTLVFWNYMLELLGYHWNWFEKTVLHPAPLPLIRKGRVLRANMRREYISTDELMSLLREQGIENVAEVKTACLEGNGKVTVIPYAKR